MTRDDGKTIEHVNASVETTADDARAPSSAQVLLKGILQNNVILLEEWQAQDEQVRHEILDAPGIDELLARLVEASLLTEFQAGRIRGGNMHRLIFGGYRLVDRIGSGGMGVVYRGEHILMRRPVALKVLQLPPEQGETMLKRFFAEMRVLSRIHHPNIVTALDAGTEPPAAFESQALHYLVMEYVIGTNLEQLVEKAPLSVSRACELIYQIATALDETHRHRLIHRDIKPSNILETPEGVAKLLDFGLALHVGRRRFTNPGTLLGTLNYMAPEQAVDAASVDIRADIFGLGATLYFALTGKPPFESQGSLTNQIAARLTQAAPEVRVYRPDVPIELQKVMCRMMTLQREDRYPTPQSVMRALLPFVQAVVNGGAAALRSEAFIHFPEDGDRGQMSPGAPRILIVDDEEEIRTLCKNFFRHDGFECQDASNGEDGIRVLNERAFDVVLLDIDMPVLSGTETLRRLRAQPPSNHLKIIMMSGRVSADELAELLALGADDYLSKPLGRQQLVARVKAALLLKATQDRSDRLNQQLLGINAELEKALVARHGDLVNGRKALIYALAQLVESRSERKSAHLGRMERYLTALVRKARRAPRLASVLDEPFLKTLVSSSLLHDIGQVAMPDHIVRASGRLGTEDNIILQAHTTIGADTLKSVAKRDRNAAAFWQMAIDIARHHHEHFDGSGYPDRLAGNDIPLAARIVALADAYDAYRSTQGLSHTAALQIMTSGSPGRFDPLLLQAFQDAEFEFERIYQSCPDTEMVVMSPSFSDSWQESARTSDLETPGAFRSGRKPARAGGPRPNPTGPVG